MAVIKMVKKAIKAYPNFVYDDREFVRLEKDSALKTGYKQPVIHY